MRSDKLNVNSNSFGEDNIRIIEISGAYTLSADDSGSCLLINAPAACSVKLPLAKGNAGVYWDIAVKTVATGDVDFDAKDTSDDHEYFIGFVSDSEVDAQTAVTFNGSSHDQLTVNADAGAGQAYIRIMSDGTSWHVSGQAVDISGVANGTASANN
jgi:hypothetical protein